MANKPNNPSLWSKAKSLAKSKFDVYPSAYANGWASKYYKSKGGTWRKGQFGLGVPKSNRMPNLSLSLSDESKEALGIPLTEPEVSTAPLNLSRRKRREQFKKLVKSAEYPVMKKNDRGEEYESRSATMNKLLATSPSESGMSLRRMRRLGQETFGEPRGETMDKFRQWYPISAIRKEQTQNSPQNANRARQKRREQRNIRRAAGPGRCFDGNCDAFKKGGMSSSKSKLKQAYLNKYK
jgi:hypothetical protein